MKKDILEKAKWQIGEVRVDGKGVAHECYGYDDSGKAQIRRVKKQHTSAAQPSVTSKTSVTKPDVKSAAEKEDNTKPQPKKASAPYDAPKPKVTYKKRHAAEIEVKVQVPEEFQIRGKDGKTKTAKRDTYRKAYAQMEDDKLLKMLNNVNNAWEIRMLAWEEAQARGLDESKVNTKGSLERKWDKEKSVYDKFHKQDDVEEDEVFFSVNNTILDSFDVDEIKSQFPNGDVGWKNPDDKRIKTFFHDLDTKADRQRYDAFLDMMKREEEYYETPNEVLQDLGRDFYMFIKDPNLPLFVSSGGAGAGKSYQLQEVFDIDDKIGFDKDKHKPGDGDYDYVFLSQDIKDEDDFAKILHEHNGKIIVFDDKDKLLTTRSGKLVNMMKALADTNKKLRKFKGPNGDDEVFTGKMIFLTNKSKETLNRNEDAHAVMTRAIKNNIYMTVNENLELLSQRYMTMVPEALQSVKADDTELEKDFRQRAFDIIMDRSDTLDPMSFSTRTFQDILFALNSNYELEKMDDANEDFSRVLGSPKDFERVVVTELNKAIVVDDNYFEKAVFVEEINKLTDEQKKGYRELYKKNPKKFAKLFGLDIIEILDGKKEAIDKSKSKKKTDDEVKKAFENELGNMTIQEAENILFG